MEQIGGINLALLLGATSQTDLGSYLLGRNTASTSVNGNTSTGGFLNTVPAGSACPQPTL